MSPPQDPPQLPPTPRHLTTGQVLFDEAPLVAIQTLASRRHSLCCAVCCCYIGGWRAQCALVLGTARRECRSAALIRGEAYGCSNQQCEEIFCSKACLAASWSNGHLLECGGVCCVSSSENKDDLEAEGTSLMSCDTADLKRVQSGAKRFYKHGITTNEIFLAARRVITTLLGSLLFSPSSFSLSSSLSSSSPHMLPVKPVTLEQTNALVHAFLQQFSMPKLFSPPLTSEVDSHIDMEEKKEDNRSGSNGDSDSRYESWLLLYTSIMQTGFFSSAVAPLLSYDFYQQVVNVLSVHLKSIRVHDPPLLAHLLRICITGESSCVDSRYIAGSADEGPKETTTKDQLHLLFDQLFNALPKDTEHNIGLSHLAQLMTATDDYSGDKSDSASVLVERGACVCMTLLPVCSALTRHSCLPNAHFAPVQQSGPSSTVRTCNDASSSSFSSGLPSSTLLRVQVEAIRDFTTTVPMSEGGTGCEGGDDDDGAGMLYEPISVAIIPHMLHSYESRTAQLYDLLQPLFASTYPAPETSAANAANACTRCGCPRCMWESINIANSTSTKFIHTKETATKLESQESKKAHWLNTTPPRVQLALANHYMQEAEKGVSESYMQAMSLYAHTVIYLEALSVEDREKEKERNVLLAMGYHAWGAAHLNLGDWYRARCIWLHAQQYSPYYKILENEIFKINSYPLLKQQGNLTDLCCHYEDIVATPTTIGTHSAAPAAIHATSAPIITHEVCQQIISWAESKATTLGSWTTSRHYAVPTTDIPVHTMPPLLAWFNAELKETIGPLLHAQYADSSSASRSVLCVHDVFVCKYEAVNKTAAEERATDESTTRKNVEDSGTLPQRLLPLHLDQSSHSFVIALNSPRREGEGGEGQFEGGGTYFPEVGKTVCPDAGHLVSFRGGSTLHGGAPVLAGVRYIMAGFLYFTETSIPVEVQNNTVHYCPSPFAPYDHLSLTALDRDLVAKLLYGDDIRDSNTNELVVSHLKQAMTSTVSPHSLSAKDLVGADGNYTFNRCPATTGDSSSTCVRGREENNSRDGGDESHKKKTKIEFDSQENYSFSFGFS